MMSYEPVSYLYPILLQGLTYSFVVMGIYISSRVIQFDDLTTEGSFGLGGALSALLISIGISSWLTLPLSMIGGALGGLVTGLLHTKMKLNNLICGLIVTTALFSLCLKGAGSNLSIHEKTTIFVSYYPSILILGVLVGIAFWSLKLLLRSEMGLLLRSLGSNPQMLMNLGKSIDWYKILGLMISNSFIALGGSIFVQLSGYFSVFGNIGTLVIGLTGLILAELIKPVFGIALIIGAILYQALFALTIEIGLDPVWNNLVKAVMIVLLMQLKNIKNKRVVCLK
jgi:putative tryptophan/tyrosine transport system permease protein